MKGSFTVELAILFPVMWLLLMVLLQFGLYFTYRIYIDDVLKRSMMICIEQRNQGAQPEEAMNRADAYLQQQLEPLPVQTETDGWQLTDGWLSEKYEVGLFAEYRMFASFHWTAQQKGDWRNPVLFRNRIDYLWEKGQKYEALWKDEIH